MKILYTIFSRYTYTALEKKLLGKMEIGCSLCAETGATGTDATGTPPASPRFQSNSMCL